MVVDGTGTVGTKWLRSSYPEIEEEELSLVPECDNVNEYEKDGIYS